MTMAKPRKKPKAKPVAASDINLRGTGEDGKRLGRYAKQEGDRAWPLLEQAFATGTVKVRTAAVRAMAQLDPARAEARFVAAIDAARGKERERLRDLLLLIDTPTAIVKAVSLGGTIRTSLDHTTRAAVMSYVAEQASRLSEDELHGLLARTHVTERYEPPLRDAARGLAAALLEHVRRAPPERTGDVWEADPVDAILHDAARLLTRTEGAMAAFVALEGAGVRLDVSAALEIWREAPPDERVAVLGTYVTDEDDRGEIARTITKTDDPAWAALLLPYIDEPEVLRAVAVLGHPPTAQKLREMASQPELDLRTRNACYLLGTIGDTEATPILLRWLAHPSGVDAAPMLLVALGACGTADAIPALEQLREQHTGRASFFALAIDEIRERTDSVSRA
jgi:hypothetical protein